LSLYFTDVDICEELHTGSQCCLSIQYFWPETCT